MSYVKQLLQKINLSSYYHAYISCVASYMNKDQRDKYLQKHAFNNVEYYNEKYDTRMLVTYPQTTKDYNSLCFAFKGTSSFRNVKTDIKAPISSWHKYNNTNVAQSWYDAFEFLDKDIDGMFAKYKDNINKYDEIIITGHSLGGVYAELFAAKISEQLSKHGISKQLTLIRYAPPLVGDEEYVKMINERLSKANRYSLYFDSDLMLFANYVLHNIGFSYPIGEEIITFSTNYIKHGIANFDPDAKLE